MTRKYKHIGVRLTTGGFPDLEYKDVYLKNDDGTMSVIKRNYISHVNLPLSGNRSWKVFKSEKSAKKWISNIQKVAAWKPSKLNEIINPLTQNKQP